MPSAYVQLLTHLREMKIGHWSNDEEQAVCVDYPGVIGSYRIFARIHGETSQFQTTGQLRICVAEGCRAAVTETIRCANTGLNEGEFEIDFDKCELRFQMSEPLIGDNLEDETVDRLIGRTNYMLDAYLPAILSVIYGNELPGDAIQHAMAATAYSQ
jgi:hypothetical protein